MKNNFDFEKKISNLDDARTAYSAALFYPSGNRKESPISYVDEAPDFYDPYSELNLFLSHQIKEAMREWGQEKKWCTKLQDLLIAKITPRFQQKFPQYRLGMLALKKTWEKVSYYLEQTSLQHQAFKADGTLNIPYLIRENLKHPLKGISPSELHPTQFAHQLGLKLCECIATLESRRPQLDHLTKMIWGVHKHLFCSGSLKTPYDSCDQVDQLIVKTLLEIKAQDPQIGQEELACKIQESLLALQELPSFSSPDGIEAPIAALLAEKFFPTSSFHTRYFAEQKKAILNFISRHAALCHSSTPGAPLCEHVRRMTALYTLASQLPKDLSERVIKEAVHTLLSPAPYEKPQLLQSVLAFISAELVLMPNANPQEASERIWDAYQEAALLPAIPEDLLLLATWKTLGRKEGLLEQLPYRMGKKIEKEIDNLLIDSPEKGFASIVRATAQFFKRAKQLIQLYAKPLGKKEIEQKIELLTVQGEMLCRSIRLENASALLEEILAAWNEKPLPPEEFVNEVTQRYLLKHPSLCNDTPQVTQRVWVYVQYAWYAHFAKSTESAYDRFLLWHISSLLAKGVDPKSSDLLQHLEEIVANALPLIPFDREHTQQQIASYILSRSPKR